MFRLTCSFCMSFILFASCAGEPIKQNPDLVRCNVPDYGETQLEKVYVSKPEVRWLGDGLYIDVFKTSESFLKELRELSKVDNSVWKKGPINENKEAERALNWILKWFDENEYASLNNKFRMESIKDNKEIFYCTEKVVKYELDEDNFNYETATIWILNGEILLKLTVNT